MCQSQCWRSPIWFKNVVTVLTLRHYIPALVECWRCCFLTASSKAGGFSWQRVMPWMLSLITQTTYINAQLRILCKKKREHIFEKSHKQWLLLQAKYINIYVYPDRFNAADKMSQNDIILQMWGCEVEKVFRIRRGLQSWKWKNMFQEFDHIFWNKLGTILWKKD